MVLVRKVDECDGPVFLNKLLSQVLLRPAPATVSYCRTDIQESRDLITHIQVLLSSLTHNKFR
jgi:hypothetical protein